MQSDDLLAGTFVWALAPALQALAAGAGRSAWEPGEIATAREAWSGSLRNRAGGNAGLSPTDVVDLAQAACRRAQNALRQVAPARVAGAENQNRRLHFPHWRLHNSTGSIASIFLRRAASSASRGDPLIDCVIHPIARRTVAGASFPGRR